jgi:predicted nucleic-acid-binding Zn-ribbon protein
MATPEQEPGSQQAAATEWLETHWPQERRACPIDGNMTWAVGQVVETRLFEEGATLIGGPVYTYFPVTCTTCGYTRFFNAVLAGFGPSGTPEVGTTLSEDESE